MFYTASSSFRTFSSIIFSSLLLITLNACTGTSTEEAKINDISLGNTIFDSGPSGDTSQFKYVTGKAQILPEYGATVPAKGESRIDPTTGVRITRLTDASELQGTQDALIVYSRYTPENSNGTLFLAFGGDSFSSWVIDRVSGNIITKLLDAQNKTIGENQEIRWDTSGNHPYRVYFRRGMKFYMIDDVRDQSNSRTLIKDFSSYSVNSTELYNDVEGDSSTDGDHWVWMAAHYDGVTYIVDAFIHYQISTNTTHTMTNADLAGTNLNRYSTLTTMPRPNMVEMSPLGTGIVLHYGRTYPGNRDIDTGTWFDGPHLWPVNFDHSTTTPIKISIDESHSGWSFDENGNEYFVSQNNREDWLDAIKIDGLNSGYANRIQIINHGDIGWSNGFHYGKVPKNRPGWVFINTYSNVSAADHLSDWGADQFVLMQMKPDGQNPTVLRLGHNYNEFTGNYRDEAPAAVNLHGNRIYVSGNWGGFLGHREVFLFEIPEDWDTRVY